MLPSSGRSVLVQNQQVPHWEDYIHIPLIQKKSPFIRFASFTRKSRLSILSELDLSHAKLIMLLKSAMLEHTTKTVSVSYFWKILDMNPSCLQIKNKIKIYFLN